jgi:hypothetical protein
MADAATTESLAADSEPVLQIDELLTATAYDHPVGAIHVQETHISWVILTGEFAYKVKKRLKLEFLDTRELATRRFLCAEELRLNRRLVTDMYLEVVPITRDAGGLHMAGTTGRAIDYAVKMRQFEPTQELPALLVRADVRAGEIRALAKHLAKFHGRAAVLDASFNYVARLRECALGNLASLLIHLPSLHGIAALGELIDWTHDSLHDLHEQFRQRQAQGYVRECHGDLHAHNIVRWQGRLTPFDCLEFDSNLRFIDVMNDVAFLVMDLIGHGRQDLAYEFLNRYVEQTGDYQGLRLLPFYVAHRALIRAMIDALSIEQRPAEQLVWKGRLQARIATAHQFVRPVRPALYLMHGPSGSGKSWLSEHLVPLVGAVRLRSDVERKRLASSATTQPADPTAMSDLYSPRRTYTRLLACAESCLLGGISVIIDAAFLKVEDRQPFKGLADQLGASFVVISCITDREEMARRIMRRAIDKADPSDATVQVLNQQLDSFVPLGADELRSVIHVNTMQPNAERAALATLRARDANTGRTTAWSTRHQHRFAPLAKLTSGKTPRLEAQSGSACVDKPCAISWRAVRPAGATSHPR